MLKKMGFATQAIHAGAMKNEGGALTNPIYQSSTFVFTIRLNRAVPAGFLLKELAVLFPSRQSFDTQVEEKVAARRRRPALLP